MKYSRPTYDKIDWSRQTGYEAVEISDEQVRERHLEKRVVSIVAQPCRGDVDDTLTITSLEGFLPHFEHTGDDLPRLLRRLNSVKRDIDLFIAEHGDGYVHPPKEPGMSDLFLPGDTVRHKSINRKMVVIEVVEKDGYTGATCEVFDGKETQRGFFDVRTLTKVPDRIKVIKSEDELITCRL